MLEVRISFMRAILQQVATTKQSKYFRKRSRFSVGRHDEVPMDEKSVPISVIQGKTAFNRTIFD